MCVNTSICIRHSSQYLNASFGFITIAMYYKYSLLKAACPDTCPPSWRGARAPAPSSRTGLRASPPSSSSRSSTPQSTIRWSAIRIFRMLTRVFRCFMTLLPEPRWKIKEDLCPCFLITCGTLLARYSAGSTDTSSSSSHSCSLWYFSLSMSLSED